MTYQRIGEVLGVSRQRVHQIVKAKGLSSSFRDTIKARRAAESAAKSANASALALSRHGCELATLISLRKSGALRAFQHQRRNAGVRGIEWKLNLGEWWGIWVASGRWGQRGKQSDQYVMSRNGDCGPYEAGNVRICTASENFREAKSHATRHDKQNTGIYLTRPGSSNPWIAKVGNRHIGSYPSPELAREARMREMLQMGKA